MTRYRIKRIRDFTHGGDKADTFSNPLTIFDGDEIEIEVIEEVRPTTENIERSDIEKLSTWIFNVYVEWEILRKKSDATSRAILGDMDRCDFLSKRLLSLCHELPELAHKEAIRSSEDKNDIRQTLHRPEV